MTVLDAAPASIDPTNRLQRWRNAIARFTDPAPSREATSLAARKSHVFILFGMAIAAMTVGYIVLPGEQERIAALERDGQFRRAENLLEARYANGDRSARTLTELQRFYERDGDTEKSRRVLEQLAKINPRDGATQRQLAALYKSTQDEDAYIGSLKSQLALRYSEPVCKTLIGLLRRKSDFAAEQATISDCSARGYRRADDLIRLAFLEAADGRLARSAQILRAVDDRYWLKEARDRFLLFESLLQSQQHTDATRRAVRWLKGQPNDELAVDMIYKMVESGRNDLAMQMARDVGQPGDGVSLTVGEIMVDQVQYAAARTYLAGWLDQAKTLDLELITRFVTAGLDAEDPMLAMKGAERYGIAKMRQPELIRLAEVLSASGNWSELDKLRGAIAPDQVARNPLLAAALEIRANRLELARSYLARVRVEDLDERRSGYFTSLREQAGRSAGSGVVLRDPGRDNRGAVPQDQIRAAVPAVVGPKQAQAKQRILRRAEANRTLKERAKNEKKAAEKAASSGGGLFPFLFPQGK